MYISYEHVDHCELEKIDFILNLHKGCDIWAMNRDDIVSSKN